MRSETPYLLQIWVGGGVYLWFEISNHMIIKPKELYEAPTTSVFEVKIEGVVCQSPLQGGNSINDWVDGGTTNDEIFM